MKRYRQGKLRNARKFIEKYPERYKNLHTKTRIIKEKAEAKIRKLKAVKALWSPTYQTLVDSIEL